jgi:hypothetical protein
MASTVDARAGWEIYRATGFDLTRDELNGRLEAAGFVPISARTFRHYGALQRKGFQTYIPINRFDTMNVIDPFKDESIRSRYATRSANVPAQVVFHQVAAQRTVVGMADSLSDLGTEIVVSGAGEVRALRNRRPDTGTPVTVNFLNPAKTAYGTVDFVVPEPDGVRLGIAFRQLVPISDLTDIQALGSQVFRFVVGDSENDLGLDVISQDVYWLFQALEGSRSFVNEILRSITVTPAESPPPTVQRLTVSSPLLALLVVGVGVGSTIALVATRIQSVMAAARSIRGAVRRHRRTPAEIELMSAQTELVRAQTASVLIANEREAMMNELRREVVDALIPSVRAAGIQLAENPQFNSERLEYLLLKDVGPSVERLTERGFELSPAPNEPGAGGSPG